MLIATILVTAMWICPGNMFSDVEKPGCLPFQQDRGSVSNEPAAPLNPGQMSAPSIAPAPSTRLPERSTQAASVNSKLCTLYEEYINLELKTQGGFMFGSTDESERWQTLKRMFQNSPAPSCR